MGPGLGRLQVRTTPDGQASAHTTDISVFSLDPTVAAYDDIKKATMVTIDGDNVIVHLDGASGPSVFSRDTSTAGSHSKSPWKVYSIDRRSGLRMRRPVLPHSHEVARLARRQQSCRRDWYRRCARCTVQGTFHLFPLLRLWLTTFFTVSTAGCLPMHTNGSGTNACHGPISI